MIRRKFLRELASNLIKPILLHRQNNYHIQLAIRKTIREMLGEKYASEIESSTTVQLPVIEGTDCRICYRLKINHKKTNCKYKLPLQ